MAQTKGLFHPREWYRLDNAAKIFPGQNTQKWSNIFRLSVVLWDKVDPDVLEQAVVMTLPRFPCFNVRMRRGFFWHYLEKNDRLAPPIQPDIQNPCHRVNWRENNRFLFRVYYHENRISIDFYHALSDAYGASRLLNTITAQYLRLRGHMIPPGESVLDLNERPTRDELSDPFQRFASSRAAPRHKVNKFAYHAKGTRMPAHMVNITTGYLPVDALKAKAKEFGVTITEFVAALLLDVHYRKQLEERRGRGKLRDVSVQIPVNLRNSFPTQTLRNFSLCYSARIDPNMGDYTFEEIVRQVSLYLRYVNNPKELNAMMSSNLKLESNPFMRFMPLLIKDFFIGLSFLITGEQSTSVLISNLGIVTVPKEMEPYIDRYVLMTGPGRRSGSRCAAVSFRNTFALTFANIYQESDIEREFFTRLVKMGVHVKIESNRESNL